MYKNGFVNALTSFFAVIFCFLLVLSIIITSAVVTVSTTLSSDTLTEMIKSIDMKETLLNSESSDKFFEEMEIGDDAVDSFLDSDASDELIEIVTEAFVGSLTNDGNAKEITEEDIEKIFEDNMDSILDMAEENSDGDFDRRKAEKDIRKSIKENSKELSEEISSLSKVTEEMDPEITDSISWLAGTELTIIFASVTAVLALLIFALRHRRFKGLLWIGWACIIASLLLFAISSSSNIILDTIDYTADDIGKNMIEILIDRISGGFFTAFLVTIITAGVLFILGIILGIVTKKKAVKSTTVPAAPSGYAHPAGGTYYGTAARPVTPVRPTTPVSPVTPVTPVRPATTESHIKTTVPTPTANPTETVSTAHTATPVNTVWSADSVSTEATPASTVTPAVQPKQRPKGFMSSPSLDLDDTNTSENK